MSWSHVLLNLKVRRLFHKVSMSLAFGSDKEDLLKVVAINGGRGGFLGRVTRTI